MKPNTPFPQALGTPDCLITNSDDATDAAPTLRPNHGITVRVAVGEAADFELCALPRGVHNYRIPLPEALAQVLHNIPCGMFLWDGECIVLTATGLDAEAMCDSTAPNAPGEVDSLDTYGGYVDGAHLR